MSRRDQDEFAPFVKHIPLQPPRESTPGEGIYLRMWQQWATDHPEEWKAIFVSSYRPRQRAACVAASFMVFMGCNGGAGFTHMAEQFARKPNPFYSRESAFLAAWAVDNGRRRGVNGGLRISEYMLARQHPYTGGRLNWDHVPVVTQEDNDYLEGMVRWWSSDVAFAMRERAKLLIEIANRQQWERDIGRGPANPAPEIDRVKRALNSFAVAA